MAEMGGRRRRFMLLGPSRVFYAGLLGEPTVRALGAVAIYVALSGSTEVETAARAWRGGIAVVPPYWPHRVRAEDRCIACILIEPESVADRALRELCSLTDDGARASRIAARIRAACETDTELLGSGFSSAELDELLFGAPIEARQLDPRIGAVIARFQVEPARPLTGRACAQATGLSLSRFLHLFKRETGVAFKPLRAWKRARAVLDHANRDTKLTDLALDIGYPDSSHFSHSVRRIYGLAPRAILSGSRGLHIVRSRPEREIASLATAFGA